MILEIIDTAGMELFSLTQEESLRQAQGLLLVFSLMPPSSLANLQELHDQIARVKSDPAVPMVLVGNKCDLEDVAARALAPRSCCEGVGYTKP